MQTKKLVYILNYVHPDDVQHFVHVLALLRTLQENHGWDVRLLSEKGGVGQAVVHGIPVRYLSQNGGAGRLVALWRALKEARADGFRLIFVRISKPAAILSSLAGKLFGMKTLYWQSGVNLDLDRARPFLQRAINGAMDRAVVKAVDRFVTGPETMLAYYRQELDVPDSKLTLLYNDVDLARFTPPATPHPRQGSLRVLAVHRFSPAKQIVLYLPAIISHLNRAASSEAPIVLTLVGDGPEYPVLQRQALAAQKGLTIEFRGAVPNAQIQDLYADADVFIMPSYREGFPRVMLEAMAMGLPVVATDAGGTRDLVGPLQSAFVVSRDEPETFAARLSALVQDEQARQAVGAENLARVQRYSTTAVAAMYDRALGALR